MYDIEPSGYRPQPFQCKYTFRCIINESCLDIISILAFSLDQAFDSLDRLMLDRGVIYNIEQVLIERID